MKKIPTNNFTPGRLSSVGTGVIHSICIDDKNDIDSIVASLVAPGKESYHYVIDRTGEIYEMVSIDNIAWHCDSGMIWIPPVHNDINKQSIGVALVGSPKQDYTSKQYSALAYLASDIEGRVLSCGLGYIDHWIGHDWIAGEMAFLTNQVTTMVEDPGPRFHWEIFSRERYRNKLANELTPEWRNKLRRELEGSYSVKELLGMLWKKIL
jgi:N-acetyl-anhydromuramyl-L-alanine amidase AmpD